MKEFWIYTGLRALLFVGSFAIVFAAWLLIADEVNLFFAVIVAFILSGIGSFFLLNGPREEFARKVQERAEKAAGRFEERKAREDQD